MILPFGTNGSYAVKQLEYDLSIIISRFKIFMEITVLHVIGRGKIDVIKISRSRACPIADAASPHPTLFLTNH